MAVTAASGQIADPLARHRAPSDELLGGNGLWLVNQVCDLVQARTGQAHHHPAALAPAPALRRRASRVFKLDEQALRIGRLPPAPDLNWCRPALVWWGRPGLPLRAG